MRHFSFIALLITACLFSFSSCGVHEAGAYPTQESVVISNQLDGTYIVRSRGRSTTQDVRGVARTGAMHAAEKRALYDVLFTTLVCQDDANGKSLAPLLPEVNAARKYDAYFTQFFSDKGEWRLYATKAGTRYLATKFSKTNNEYVCDMSVCINRQALRTKLINDGILK